MKLPEKERKEYEKHIDELRFRASILMTEQIKLKHAEEKGLKKGIKKGKEEGLREAKITTAKNLKALGVDIQIIIQSTGLSEEEIKNL